jgi:hypothetical protein
VANMKVREKKKKGKKVDESTRKVKRKTYEAKD